MIGDVLVFLRKNVDALLRSELGDLDDSTSDKVVFVDGDKIEPITFKLGAVTQLLINVEEERVMRSADPYRSQASDGSPQRAQPDIRLFLHILFIARFKQYELAWTHLSKIIEHFQGPRVFMSDDTPGLPAQVEKLVLELVTLDFARQNEVWNALRTTHHPSILYRVGLIALRDQKPQAVPRVAESRIDVRRLS